MVGPWGGFANRPDDVYVYLTASSDLTPDTMHQTSAADEAFYRSFAACQLPAGTFHHREHIQLAYIMLVRHPLDEAYTRTKNLLLNFLHHHGASDAKYHVTMTRAWLMAVRYFMDKGPVFQDAASFIEAYPVLLDPSIMFTHYSRECLLSDDARMAFVEPDLDPIPRQARDRPG